jgi:hypothetical protein
MLKEAIAGYHRRFARTLVGLLALLFDLIPD